MRVMKSVTTLDWMRRIWKATRGQDMIEYAIMAGFAGAAIVAVIPGIGFSIEKIFMRAQGLLMMATLGRSSWTGS